MRQQGVGRSVQLRYRDNIATGVSKIYEREVQGGLTAANGKRPDAAFEFGDAPLENSTCWVSDPAVAKALNFQIEQGGAVIGAIECVRCGLINRDRDGLGGWVWLIATMYGNSLITHLNTTQTSHTRTEENAILEILSLSRVLNLVQAKLAPVVCSLHRTRRAGSD